MSLEAVKLVCQEWPLLQTIVEKFEVICKSTIAKITYMYIACAVKRCVRARVRRSALYTKCSYVTSD